MNALQRELMRGAAKHGMRVTEIGEKQVTVRKGERLAHFALAPLVVDGDTAKPDRKAIEDAMWAAKRALERPKDEPEKPMTKVRTSVRKRIARAVAAVTGSEPQA